MAADAVVERPAAVDPEVWAALEHLGATRETVALAEVVREDVRLAIAKHWRRDTPVRPDVEPGDALEVIAVRALYAARWAAMLLRERRETLERVRQSIADVTVVSPKLGAALRDVLHRIERRTRPTS